jgi:AraC-like DNA-binding protein
MAERPVFDPAAFHAWALVREGARRIDRVEVLRGRAAVPGFEAHPTPTLIAALAGVVRIEPAIGGAIDLQPGSAMVIAPGTGHRHTPLRAGAAGYDQGFIRGRSDIVLVVGGRRWWVTIPAEPSRALAERLFTARDGDVRRRLAGELMTQFTDSLAFALPEPPLPARRMIEYLRAHRYRPIRAEDVARASGLGRCRAFALFRTHFGETPGSMLARDRIALARHLLREGASVAECARRAGFSSPDHLGRAFRRIHGASPTEWRRP